MDPLYCGYDHDDTSSFATHMRQPPLRKKKTKATNPGQLFPPPVLVLDYFPGVRIMAVYVELDL